MRIDWSQRAIADLEALHDYIARDSPIINRLQGQRAGAAVAGKDIGVAVGIFWLQALPALKRHQAAIGGDA